MLAFLILAPLVALVLLNVPGWGVRKKSAFWPAMLLCVIQMFLAIYFLPRLHGGSGQLDVFFGFGLQTDNLTSIMLLTIGIVMAATLLVGQSMIADERRRFNFVNVLLISLIGMNGIALVRDLFSLYVFLEVTAVSSFVLIASSKERDALEGAFKYIIMSAVASVLMISAIALLLLVAGDTSFSAVGKALTDSDGNVIVKIAVGAFVCGLFIKGGLVPFHGWVPGAYTAAPAPVSVLLAGVATKASGIYALLRLAISLLTPTGAVSEVLMLVGAVSIVVGALAALGQGNMKRLLAYSSISQIGYIVLAVGCGTPLAIIGAAFHFFNHAVFKSLLFVNSAALEQRLGTTELSEMGGVGSRMPVTNITSVVGILSTAGVPPLAGFWSKLIIIVVLWQSHHYSYAMIAVLFSVVTLAYLLVMHRRVFFGKVSEQFAALREAGTGLVVASLALAAVTVVGFVPLLFFFLVWAGR